MACLHRVGVVSNPLSQLVYQSMLDGTARGGQAPMERAAHAREGGPSAKCLVVSASSPKRREKRSNRMSALTDSPDRLGVGEPRVDDGAQLLAGPAGAGRRGDPPEGGCCLRRHLWNGKFFVCLIQSKRESEPPRRQSKSPGWVGLLRVVGGGALCTIAALQLHSERCRRRRVTQ